MKHPPTQEQLAQLEWCASVDGPGLGAMDSGGGCANPACPVCGGLKKKSRDMSTPEGHSKKCWLGKSLDRKPKW